MGARVAEENLRTLLGEVFKQAGVQGVRAASAGVASANMPGVAEWISVVFRDFGVERSEAVSYTHLCNVFFLRKQPHASRRAGRISAKKSIAPVWPLPLGMPYLQGSQDSAQARQAGKKKSPGGIGSRQGRFRDQRSEIS